MPAVSVIIPTYQNGAEIGRAIDSILKGAWEDFEIVVVDDGSTDHTAQVVASYSREDPRVRYLYQENRGLPAARNTGIRASEGSYLAFLDADDSSHPQRLELQHNLLAGDPDAGLTYCHRIAVDSSGRPLFLQRSPAESGLAELINDYPFVPSDVMLRRDWAERVGLFDESFRLNSEDLDFHLRLSLAGCVMKGVDRALTYRQIHAGRIFKNIPGKIETYLRALDTAFLHPDCPPEILGMRDSAFARHYRFWGVQAMIQEEVPLGQDLLRGAVRLDPALLDDGSSALLHQIIWHCMRDGEEHEARVRHVLANLPPELAHLRGQADWAVARGSLERGVREIIWGRTAAGREHFARARALNIELDLELMRKLSSNLTGYELEFGHAKGEEAFRALVDLFRKIASPAEVRLWSSTYALNRAFRDFYAGEYRQVPGSVLRAIATDPGYLTDRGVLSIFARSLIGSLGR